MPLVFRRADAMRAVSRRSERALSDELEAAKAAAKDAAAAFAAKRAERCVPARSASLHTSVSLPLCCFPSLRSYTAFMAAFNHIAAALDPIYKALTRAPEHPMGGSAFLSTENAEEARAVLRLCCRAAWACMRKCAD